MVSGTESCACTGTAVQINNRIIAVVKAGQLGRNLFRIRARIAKIILQPLGESALLYPANFFVVVQRLRLQSKVNRQRLREPDAHRQTEQSDRWARAAET